MMQDNGICGKLPDKLEYGVLMQPMKEGLMNSMAILMML